MPPSTPQSFLMLVPELSMLRGCSTWLALRSSYKALLAFPLLHCHLTWHFSCTLQLCGSLSWAAVTSSAGFPPPCWWCLRTETRGTAALWNASHFSDITAEVSAPAVFWPDTLPETGAGNAPSVSLGFGICAALPHIAHLGLGPSFNCFN